MQVQMKASQEIKEYDFNTLWNLLSINANEIAYPQEAPANTSEKIAPQGFKKYGSFDLRNYTDNKGWIPIKINYQNFKPKKYYKDVDEEILQKHLQALQKQEDLLKHFKHSQDFDRIDYYEGNKSNTYQGHMQKMLFCHAAISFIASRVLTVQNHYNKFSFTLWRTIFKRTYFYTLPFALIIGTLYQSANPINHEFFRSTPKAIRMYETMAYGADAFQYNNDLKYNFKYPEREDYEATLHNVYERRKDSLYQDCLRYYKKHYGIVDAEPFWNHQNNKTTKQTA